MGRETKPPTGYLFSVPARLTRSADIPLGKRDACPAIPPVGSPWFLVWHFSLVRAVFPLREKPLI